MFADRTYIEFVYQDASGSTGALTVQLPIATTYASAAAAASALVAVVASVTSCVLVRQRIIYKRVIDGSPPAAVGSSVKRRAVFYCNTGLTTPLAIVEVLSPLDSIFETTGPCASACVDMSNTDVIAFINELIADNAANPFGDAIIDVVSAYLESRV